ncbi:MAG: DUF305 domain-containing protein [Desulfovibrionaceae bacterium]|nr:DUF305 domain-containing protein [Desulfovibrionaceae bacterium]MBF0513735.1 DUF305 domain-containing protein [Desulfovibrionaceae bacterium]
MNSILRHSLNGLALAFAIVLACGPCASALAGETSAKAAEADEKAFMEQNKPAMDAMMRDMDVKPTGDVDRDFTAMMIPHHQGAIDMARIYLRYGRDKQLRRLCQNIIVAQEREIKLMRSIAGDSHPSATTPAPSVSAPRSMQPGMKMN